MASRTQETETRRAQKKQNQGRKRKNKLARKSTLSYEEFFAAVGEPGKPTPKKK